MMFAQESPLVGDVDCNGEVNSEDASLILQFVTNIIAELPCQENMTGLNPEQLQEIIGLMEEQLSVNYNIGGGSIYPTMISSESDELFSFGAAMEYCRDLEENDYDDWFLPNFDQLAYAVSGGCEVPDEITNDYLWTTKLVEIASSYIRILRIEDGEHSYNTASSSYRCRCVRFGGIDPGEESVDLAGSASPIGANSEQPISMIGPMYKSEDFPDFTTISAYEEAMYIFEAYRFCGELEYGGYDDWVVPSYYQLVNYITTYSTIDIPNQTENIQAFFYDSSNADVNYINITENNFPAYMGSSGESYNDLKACFCVR